MNRRRLIQTMLATPVVAALGGCQRDKDYPSGSPTPTPAALPAQGGTLKVILQGPFAVAIDTRNHFRIKAFVPFSGGEHEFRFAKPGEPFKPSDEGTPDNRRRFQFTLLEENLEISDRLRHIDSGFADFTLHTGPWEPSPKDYFVVVDLPAPEFISFIPPSTPVLFAASRLGMMPTNHVLEYRVRDFSQVDKVKLRSPTLGDTAPISCLDLLRQGKPSEKGTGKDRKGAGQGRQFAAEFEHCEKEQVRAFVLGVGLPPESPAYLNYAPAHALKFFNEQLLRAFPNSPDRDRLKLLEVDVKPCRSGGKEKKSSVLIPAVQRYMMPQPRLLPVSAADECRLGGLNAIIP
jgi:hypothetical protein